MSDAKSPPDLSMEEILASIRRIIAEDEQPAGGESAGEPLCLIAGEDEAILELTEAINEDGSIRRLTGFVEPISADEHPAEPAPEPAAAAPASAPNETVPEAHPTPSPAVEGETPAAGHEAGMAQSEARVVGSEARMVGSETPTVESETPTVQSEVQPADAPASAELVSAAGVTAIAASFARIAELPATPASTALPPPLLGGHSLDEAVRDLLRPLLQAWLDEHLPPLVERLVTAEIARIRDRSPSR